MNDESLTLRESIYDCFKSFLLKQGLETALCDKILEMAEHQLPAFLNSNFNAGIDSIYDIRTKEETTNYQESIILNPILKSTDHGMEDEVGVSYTNMLIYYRRFLKSRYHPDHKDYIAPTPVPGELGDTQDDQYIDGTSIPEIHEGAEIQDMHKTGHERSDEARELCIQLFKKAHGGRLFCACCGFDFSMAYRDIGEGFIEVHHRFPISQRGGDYVVDPAKDLVPLCSNCHSMIHRVGGKGDCMSVDELREKYLIGKRYIQE